ncbi:DUF4062 domain-containing protein (plasmid) [Tenacibaculum finnmarkense]|nr:DUF4062 domain-containing protein [Tenacibaculum finnmarkense]
MKRYQVFVSSTYKDLVEERKEVIQALLELDCIPVGMELFPATDDDQWTLIKELIEDCDYYILIVGGRYGSLNSNGISYTQMEYANKIQIPTISFLNKSPDEIPVSKTDKNASKQEKLEDFIALASKKMVKFWNTPEDLGSVVSRSLIKLIKTKPRIGWVKADKISSEDANIEIIKLKQQIQDLEKELNTQTDFNQEELSKGEDLYEIKYAYRTSKYSKTETDSITISWNNLFAKTCTILMDEAEENDYRIQIGKYIKFLTKDKEPKQIENQIILDRFHSILIQFKALGLIEKSIKKRQIKDNNTYLEINF